MLKLQFIKSIRERVVIYIFGVTLFAFLLGYALPIGVDKVKELTSDYFFFSTYTVFSQFGFLIYSFVIAQFFYKDYAEKNILFYRLYGMNSFKFFIDKVIVLFIETFVSIIICTCVASMIFKDFGFFISSTLMFSIILLQYILIVGIFAMLFSNVLVSIALSIIYWITSVICSSFDGMFKNLAIFDASNSLYDDVERYFAYNAPIPDMYIKYIFFYMITLVLISIIISTVCNNRWKKLGIQQ